jgi:NitT/TauT family transport system substrate-binding protein
MKPLLSKLLVILLTSACTPAANSDSQLTPIVLQLGATHQAIYAGFYAADQNGDYAREGLKVSFIEGGDAIDLVAPVLDGTASFGVMGASSLILERANGKPVRALATVLRRDPVVFFSLADSGITHLEDFIGRKVYVSARSSSRLHAMLGHAGIPSDQIIEINTGSITDLYTGKIDVASGLSTSAVLSVQQDGYEVNIIYPDDYGVHFYSTTIFASDDYIASNPELVTRFLRASLNGWVYAVENSQMMGAMVRLYNPDADSAFETASMIATLPYINTGEDHIGWMKREAWEGMVQTLLDEGEIPEPLNVDDLYTLQFVQQIYGEDNP